jgi:hypothetical protein
MYNLPAEQMHAPVIGPLHHNQKDLLQGERMLAAVSCWLCGA